MGEYKNLEAWRAAHGLALEVYRVTAEWPTAERYGLTAQVRRAAFSIAVNIVEGSRRRGAREFRRFLDIALASLAEVEYTLEFASAAAVTQPEAVRGLTPLIQHTGKLCFGLARSLERASRSR
jgi:four helix bundle protein